MDTKHFALGFRVPLTLDPARLIEALLNIVPKEAAALSEWVICEDEKTDRVIDVGKIVVVHNLSINNAKQLWNAIEYEAELMKLLLPDSPVLQVNFIESLTLSGILGYVDENGVFIMENGTVVGSFSGNKKKQKRSCDGVVFSSSCGSTSAMENACMAVKKLKHKEYGEYFRFCILCGDDGFVPASVRLFHGRYIEDEMLGLVGLLPDRSLAIELGSAPDGIIQERILRIAEDNICSKIIICLNYEIQMPDSSTFGSYRYDVTILNSYIEADSFLAEKAFCHTVIDRHDEKFYYTGNEEEYRALKAIFTQIGLNLKPVDDWRNA